MAQDNEAEKLYRSFEKKLAAAKTFKVAFDLEVNALQLKYKGDVTVSVGNKLTASAAGTQDNKPDSWALVSDGAKIGLKHNKEGREGRLELAATPQQLSAYFTGHLLKGGVLLALQDMKLKRLAENSPDKIGLTGFKIVGKEKIGDREAQVVEYTAQAKEGKLACRLWFESKTNMPLKRTVELSEGREQFRIVELYTNWQLDPKLKDDEFALPK
jgi:hypothetical protein